ncbi:hypothetical protein GLA29479_3760 [Lysobacter antibioticus]|nr:hypothetical protein GLA29479_3760 [Lysobacter antibioticus]
MRRAIKIIRQSIHFGDGHTIDCAGRNLYKKSLKVRPDFGSTADAVVRIVGDDRRTVESSGKVLLHDVALIGDEI